MAGRLDYAVSVSPVQQGSALEGTTPEAVESDIGRSLGGGNSSTVWTGTLVGAGATSAGGWKAGAHTHIEANSNGFTQVGAVNDDMVWIKHTGKRYDSSTTDKLKADGTVDTVAVSVYSGEGSSEVELCQLKSGEAIALPLVKAKLWVKSASATGSAPAVEVAQFQ